MRQITYDVVVDGGTDRALLPIIQWAIHRIDPTVEIVEPTFRTRRGGVVEFLSTYEPSGMLVFVHRDAENIGLDERSMEFEGIDRQDVVRVVPVRMTEAWLTFDPRAIGMAASNPDCMPDLPSLSQLESVNDPKTLLEEALKQCAGSPTGRRKKVLDRRMTELRVSVASYINDFSPLEKVPSFQAFMTSLRDAYPYQQNI